MKIKELEWKSFYSDELYAGICFGLEFRVVKQHYYPGKWASSLYSADLGELLYLGMKNTKEEALTLCQEVFEENIMEEIKEQKLSKPDVKCKWRQESVGYDEWMYNTSCGELFWFMEEGPLEHRTRYCPFCGKPIDALPYREEREMCEAADCLDINFDGFEE